MRLFPPVLISPMIKESFCCSHAILFLEAVKNIKRVKKRIDYKEQRNDSAIVEGKIRECRRMF
jgi:hypothetical protein